MLNWFRGRARQQTFHVRFWGDDEYSGGRKEVLEGQDGVVQASLHVSGRWLRVRDVLGQRRVIRLGREVAEVSFDPSGPEA